MLHSVHPEAPSELSYPELPGETLRCDHRRGLDL